MVQKNQRSILSPFLEKTMDYIKIVIIQVDEIAKIELFQKI